MWRVPGSWISWFAAVGIRPGFVACYIKPQFLHKGHPPLPEHHGKATLFAVVFCCVVAIVFVFVVVVVTVIACIRVVVLSLLASSGVLLRNGRLSIGEHVCRFRRRHSTGGTG